MESVSGCGVEKIKVIKPILIKKSKINNLIEYLIDSNGEDYIQVDYPNDIHKEALKIKAIYPFVKVSIIRSRIKISL
jgi:hypothetical protein